jgi:signal transduction histidine kinase
MFDDVLKHRSGRVVALARAVLAATFLFAIWIDPTQPTHDVAETYFVLVSYLASSIAFTMLIWNNWWLDAKLGAVAHVIDMAAFTLLVLATDGYTSPFFVFFVFLVVSAAIRWGWRETTLTAVAVSLLFFGATVVTADAGPQFELQRFIIRSGNLVILSALLIWFGINHGFSSLTTPKGDLFKDVPPDDSPLETAVEQAARLTSAPRAILIWRASERQELSAVALSNGDIEVSALPGMNISVPATPFLFDIARDRAFSRGPSRQMRFSKASSLLDPTSAALFGSDEGLAVPIRTDTGEGLLLLCQIRSLCIDHVDFGEILATAVSAHIQRYSLLAAVREGARAKARLSLARDLHDSIVQFLAGATFRVEAIRRAFRTGASPDHELQELKELLLHEQQELRSAIGALRSDTIALPSLAADLRTLCDRLARQWDIQCNFSADVPDRPVPMRLHLDTHQLVREAVANAVRHAKSKSVTVELSAEDDDLRLDIGNDGSGSARLKEGSPWSLRERVDEAEGTLMLATRTTGTNLSITLPLKPELRP